MEWFRELVFGTGIAHSILLLALVIAVGAALAKIKVAGVSLGMTWILFVGIVASHFGLVLDPVVLGFIRDFGLIVFIFAVGMQVGPSFFSSFRKGGLKLNGFAVLSIALSVGIALILCKVADVKLTTMTGILCGAVTNTPGLGAAQEAYHDATGVSDPSIAMGYAVAYPLGVIGIILSMILLRVIFRVNIEAENKRLEEARRDDPSATNTVSVKVTNPVFSGKKIADMKKLCTNRFVISRIMHPDGTVDIAAGHSVINLDDVLYMVVSAKDSARVASFIGEEVTVDDDKWREENQKYVSRRIVITKPQINGRYLGDLKLRNNFGVNVVRVNRAGIDLAATANLQLQMGDRLTVVGEEAALQDVANMLGNQLKRLRHPNIIPIFVCLLLGALLGSIPFYFGNIPQPVKLGLAGGTLVVAILVGRFGPKIRMITYTTVSANLMLREIGISMFLAAVGLGAGSGFVETIVGGGWKWIGYGFIITVLPLLITGFIAHKWGKVDFFTLMGMMAGGTTDPPALSFASSISPNDLPAVGYTTFYPLTMFLRIITAQMLILLAV